MIKRKHARLSIVLLLSGIVCLLLGIAFENTFYSFAIVVYIMSVVLVAAAVVVSFKYLKCPGCRRRSSLPQWSGGGKHKCRYCGTEYSYDK